MFIIYYVSCLIDFVQNRSDLTLATTHLHVVPRVRIRVEQYLHFLVGMTACAVKKRIFLSFFLSFGL